MKLKDCCTIIAGQSPESKYYNSDGIGIPFFQGKADFGEVYPRIRVYCSQPTKIAEKDDILLSVRAPVGPTNLSPGTVCIGRGLTAIRPSEILNLRYFVGKTQMEVSDAVGISQAQVSRLEKTALEHIKRCL